MNYDALHYYFTKYLEYYPFILPLGAIGVWRWSVWGIKKFVGAFYKPKKAGFKAAVSVVTPVYNENPKLFLKAITSWAANKPKEIIAVIDYTDKTCIKIFQDFSKKNKFAKLIITKVPGKRAALALGIRKSKSEILALIDSDTVWDNDTLRNGIAPFTDKKIGGVATRQSLEKPVTLAQKLFSIRLEQRYWDDTPFLARAGHVLVCLSGRTAFYRRKAIMPVLKDMVNEYFMGEKVISGEDKRLTYLIEEKGWKTTYQSNSQVYTVGERKMGTYLNQQIRWTRNSWRADLRALYQRWVFRTPIFAIYLIDRAIQPFTLLISPVYFLFSLAFGLWIPVLTILLWWVISRTIKMIPHLKKYPLDIVILPFFIVFNFLSAYIRIYSLLSLNTQGWITRWDSSRLTRLTRFQTTAAHFATFLVFAAVGAGLYINKNQNFLIPRARQEALLAQILPRTNTFIASAASPNVLGAFSGKDQELLTQKYEFQPGDTIASVAAKYDVTFQNLLLANVAKITQWGRIPAGLIFTIPPKSVDLVPQYKFNYQRMYPDYLQIVYDPLGQQIVISGRGKIVTLADIAESVGPEHLEEVSPKVWILKTSLYFRSGVTFKLNAEDATWIKMISNKKKFTRIFAYNSDILIEGVKITSWDETLKNYDTNISDGRSYILVKDGSRMDLSKSELAYLGYPRTPDLPFSPYGVSWRMSNGVLGKVILTGEITNSKFHHNYFGAYTFGASGMTWQRNEFYENIRYGLDPHDDSNGFLVENNIFRNNGTHGLIFSKRCINNIIRNNISYDNKIHGIMLHELSNGNVIENNRLYGNTDGVALDHSSNNVVRNNIVTKNKRGVRANKGSVNNIIENNSITENEQYGIYLYGKSGKNTIQNNFLTNNVSAIYIKSDNNQAVNNTLDKNENGIYFLGDATQNKVAGNKITYSGTYGIYAKLSTKFANYIDQDNFIWRNKKNLVASEEVQ